MVTSYFAPTVVWAMVFLSAVRLSCAGLGDPYLIELGPGYSVYRISPFYDEINGFNTTKLAMMGVSALDDIIKIVTLVLSAGPTPMVAAIVNSFPLLGYLTTSIVVDSSVSPFLPGGYDYDPNVVRAKVNNTYDTGPLSAVKQGVSSHKRSAQQASSIIFVDEDGVHLTGMVHAAWLMARNDIDAYDAIARASAATNNIQMLTRDELNAVYWACFFEKYLQNQPYACGPPGGTDPPTIAPESLLDPTLNAPVEPNRKSSRSPTSVSTRRPTRSRACYIPTPRPPSEPVAPACAINVTQTQAYMWNSDGIIYSQWSVSVINLDSTTSVPNITLKTSMASQLIECWNFVCDSATEVCEFPDWRTSTMDASEIFEWRYITTSSDPLNLSVLSPSCTTQPTAAPTALSACYIEISQNVTTSWKGHVEVIGMLSNLSPSEPIFNITFRFPFTPFQV